MLSLQSLWKAYRSQANHAQIVLLLALLLLVPLSSCNTPSPPPLFTSLNLGIPDAALHSPVKGPLPDATELNVGITFKIDPKLLDSAAQQKIQPGQPSKLEQFANRIGISDSTYQKIKGFFNLSGIALKLSKLRTHLGIHAKASTLAKVLQTKFVIHDYKGRTFFAPATPPKVPTFLASSIDAITGLDNYSAPPIHALSMQFNKPLRSSTNRTGGHATQDCNADPQTLFPSDIATAYGYNTLLNRGISGQNMTINLVEVDGSYRSDIQNYLSCVGYKGHLSFTDIDYSPTQALGESTLDVQMVAGLAPDANIAVYQTDGNANDDTWAQVNDALQQIIDDNTNNASAGSVVSISLGMDEADMASSDVTAIDSSLRQLTQVEHMTVFIASGDCGAFANRIYGDLSVSFPA
ncbi:MAG TPA: protease pro-enzyme activation domain-containing protein, partial [Ktedonobacteraceae bacterium]|nr:protease pro-enzyme activation domain-containing protein [Ktedonobacteraceae bacterium]